MEISQTLLGLMYVWAVVTGAAWGVVYDLLRLTRVALGVSVDAPRGRRWTRTWQSVLVFCEDVLFGLVGGVLLILLLYYTNDGQFRGLAVLGMVSGHFAYYHTVGRLIRRCSDWLVATIKRLFRFMGRCVCWPFRMGYRLYRRTVGRRLEAAWERRRRRRAEAETRLAGQRHIEEASVGFGLYVEDTDDVPQHTE